MIHKWHDLNHYSNKNIEYHQVNKKVPHACIFAKMASENETLVLQLFLAIRILLFMGIQFVFRVLFKFPPMGSLFVYSDLMVCSLSYNYRLWTYIIQAARQISSLYFYSFIFTYSSYVLSCEFYWSYQKSSLYNFIRFQSLLALMFVFRSSILSLKVGSLSYLFEFLLLIIRLASSSFPFSNASSSSLRSSTSYSLELIKLEIQSFFSSIYLQASLSYFSYMVDSSSYIFLALLIFSSKCFSRKQSAEQVGFFSLATGKLGTDLWLGDCACTSWDRSRQS